MQPRTTPLHSMRCWQIECLDTRVLRFFFNSFVLSFSFILSLFFFFNSINSSPVTWISLLFPLLFIEFCCTFSCLHFFFTFVLTFYIDLFPVYVVFHFNFFHLSNYNFCICLYTAIL